VKKINLTKGFCAVVDNDDYKHLSKFHWYTSNNKRAYRRLETDVHGKQHKLAMHREVMFKQIRESVHKNPVVDHINGDPLDNRKSNLRVVSQSVNAINGRKRSNNKSGNVGVCRSVVLGRIRKDGTRNMWLYWRSYVVINGKQFHLGRFKNKTEAIRSRNEFLKKQFPNMSFPNNKN